MSARDAKTSAQPQPPPEPTASSRSSPKGAGRGPCPGLCPFAVEALPGQEGCGHGEETSEEPLVGSGFSKVLLVTVKAEPAVICSSAFPAPAQVPLLPLQPPCKAHLVEDLFFPTPSPAGLGCVTTVVLLELWLVIRQLSSPSHVNITQITLFT